MSILTDPAILTIAVTLAAVLAALHLLEVTGVDLPWWLSLVAKPAGYVAAAIGGAVAILQALGRPDLHDRSDEPEPDPPEADPEDGADELGDETAEAVHDDQEPSDGELADDLSELAE